MNVVLHYLVDFVWTRKI